MPHKQCLYFSLARQRSQRICLFFLSIYCQSNHAKQKLSKKHDHHPGSRHHSNADTYEPFDCSIVRNNKKQVVSLKNLIKLCSFCCSLSISIICIEIIQRWWQYYFFYDLSDFAQIHKSWKLLFEKCFGSHRLTWQSLEIFYFKNYQKQYDYKSLWQQSQVKTIQVIFVSFLAFLIKMLLP